jgi:NTE family protein
VTHLPDSIPDTALAHLFSRDDLMGETRWFSLPGGQTLFDAGEMAEDLYFVRTGRLAAIRRDEGQEPRFLGVIRPGEPAGEMAMIARAPHSASVVAIRDSEILAMPSSVFFAAAESDPEVMIELARLMILRARQTAGKTSIGEPSVFGFVGVSPDVLVRDLVEKVAREVEALGFSVATAGEEVLHAPIEWFSNVEQAHDFVLYAAEFHQVGWTHLVSRQVDRLFRVGRGDSRPPHAPSAATAEALQNHLLVDLILLQNRSLATPTGSAAWFDALQPARLFHLRDGERADTQRIARTITGTSVGLVLSGGAARAYAHVGAIRALHEANVPIDFIGGASMGAVVGAGLAMGWDDAEIDWRIRKAFVDTSPVDDLAFPMVALIHGEKVRARLKEHFGEQQIEDLWLPFFCISSNLTSGAYQIHRRGKLRHALRASIAIPGLLPPVSWDDNVLVDGAVMKNFPTDVMRSMHLGPIVGVDVTRGRSINADDVKRPPSFWGWVASGEWRQGPPIVSLLLRAATVSTGREISASREASDVLVLPDIDNIKIQDWKAFDPCVAAGHEAMAEALAKLTKPVTDLRRRQSLLDPPDQPPVLAGMT